MKAFVRHLPLLALLLLASCEKGTSYADLGEEGIDGTELISNETKKFAFTCKGDFSSVYQSSASSGAKRAKKAPIYLSNNGQNMTDLWVLDYSGGWLFAGFRHHHGCAVPPQPRDALHRVVVF